MMYLSPNLKTKLSRNIGFDQITSLEGTVYRKQKGRSTTKITLDASHYFIKVHKGVGWSEILKELYQGRIPTLSARTEWEAIIKLNQLGIDTMVLEGYGEEGLNPARKKSFVITQSLENTQSLEDYCKSWSTTPPLFSFKQAIIKKLALITRKLHKNGLNHRDYYICHFLMNNDDINKQTTPEKLKLFLIDLHRVQSRKTTPIRWIIKDLGSLYYNAMEHNISQKDCFRFIQLYENRPLREALTKNRAFWKSVEHRGHKLYEKAIRKGIIQPET